MNRLLVITDNDSDQETINTILETNKKHSNILIKCSPNVEEFTFEVCLFNSNQSIFQTFSDKKPGTIAEYRSKSINQNLAYMLKNKTALLTTGVEIFKNPEPLSISGRPNPRYFKKEDYRHYLYNEKYYSSRMSELILAQSKEVLKMMFERLEGFCDHLYFDELQDFMGKDFDLLILFVRDSNLNVFAVGDFHQHSVSKSDFTARKPYIKKGEKFLSKEEYKLLFKGKATIDETTLVKSRRVPEKICTLISSKLGIYLESSSPVEGHYELLEDESKISYTLEDSTTVKLFYNNSTKYSCSPAINWGYSKGDTYKKSCIILTKTFDSLFEDDFSRFTYLLLKLILYM